MLFAFYSNLLAIYSCKVNPGNLTKPRVEHVECHLVALLGTSDCDKTFIAIVLRLVDLDNGSRQLSDFVDLGASLADDGTHHVVGDEDLLGEGLAGKHVHPGGGLGTALRTALGHRGSSLTRLVRTSASILTTLIGSGIVNRGLGGRRGSLAVKVRNAVGVCGCPLRGVIMLAIGVGVAVLAVEGLRLVRNHLHATGDGSRRSAGARSIGGGSRTTISLGKLLDQSVGNVVCSDVNGIRDTSDNKRALGGKRQRRSRGVQAGARSILDFADARAGFADDGADQDVGNKKPQGIGL